MSDNPITVLYVKDEDGNLKRIEPKTIADAVNDETNVDTVQAFINDGIDDWSNVSEDKKYQYATAIFLKNQFDDFGLKFKNTMKYDIPDWDVTEQTDYSGIKLPVKRGYTYKVVGEESEINGRIFKPGDFAIINKDIDVDGEITDEDIDLLIGYGNEGTKIYRYVADVVKTREDLLNYEEPKENSVIIVINDEKHNQMLSFYEYIIGFDWDYEVDTYDDLIHIQTRLDVPNYEYSIDENVRIITLLKYTGELLNVPVPYVLYPKQYDIVRVKTDETHENQTTYYQWNEEQETWDYIEPTEFNWVYMFSKESENSVYRVKGTVPTYERLPKIDNQVGDVWNVEDTGANYVWTSDGWDKLSETYDLSKYETVENSTIKINNERTRATNAEEHLQEEINSLLYQLGEEIERATNAESQLQENIETNSSNLSNEIERATNAESQLNNAKLDKISTPNKIYGTDANGNQTTYDYGVLGSVDDVRVNGSSVVVNKIADISLGSMAEKDANDYYTKEEIEEITKIPEISQATNGKFLSNNGVEAEWKDLNPPVVFRDWNS